MSSENTITFRHREFRGSRFRCLLATSSPRVEVARFLNCLAPADFRVTEKHQWAPAGFLNPEEAKLGESDIFLSEPNRKILQDWWLVNRRGANTPNWDLVSQCDYAGTPGLMLVEAKAHHGEFDDDSCSATDQQNLNRIQGALAEASHAWNDILPGFSLSADSKYQLSNRFAFAWKIASLGVPVVLIYLGFLNATDMSGNGRRLLESHEDWESCVKTGSKSHVPEAIWSQPSPIKQLPLKVLICSATVEVCAECTAEVAR